MSRRSSPERIHAARRAAVLSRLTQERRLSEQRAEALVGAWETKATQRGLDRESAVFWDSAEQWILQQRRTR